MWGDGRLYWGRKETDARGIVIAFAWMSSKDKNLGPYVRLYSSLGWNSLVCHANFFNLFFPEKAMSLALNVLDELIKVVRHKACPIVLASFSGGAKACMYKLLQVIDGNVEGRLSQDEYRMIRNCICGQVYDSSPVDFTSDIGTKFVLHPSVLKMSSPPRLISWTAKAVASSLDSMFLTRHEEQCAEYWQTLYASVRMAPFLIFCSEDDELAPCQIICNFVKRLQDLGGDVKLVKWKNSPHVGHYKCYPAEYRNAIGELLAKSSSLYSQRNSRHHSRGMENGIAPNETSKSACDLHQAANGSKESFGRVAVGPSDHFFLPSSMEFLDVNDIESMQYDKKQTLPHLANATNINPHGVLGKILFDVCVPKNVEGWDVRKDSLPIHAFTSGCKNASFNPIKCIRRSRL